MDEDALRAMMPMSFGKKAPTRPISSKQKSHAGEHAAGSFRLGTHTADNVEAGTSRTRGASFENASEKALTLKKASSHVQPDEDASDLDEDGLTAEERRANEMALERSAANADASSHSDDNDSDDEDALGPEPTGPDITTALPLDDVVILKDHSKAVTALSVDASGARIASGSLDYDVKLWDFGGMTQSFKPFKTFEPFESHTVRDVAWSPNGERLLVAAGTAQPKVYDRNGNLLLTYKKGDLYIRDMKNTAGHVAEVTSCFWHPIDRALFATSSADSTVRLWDLENPNYQKTVVVVKSKERGTRTKVTCAAFSPDGKMLAAGCLDGALHIWSTSGTYSRPNATIEGAHAKDTETSSVCFTKDGRALASRGGDGTVKLWDVRAFKKPLAVRTGLPNSYAQTNVVFSPDETAVLTGTSAERAEEDDEGRLGPITEGGRIEVLSRSDLRTLKSIENEGDPSSVVKVAWQPRINQILAATSSGAIHLHFSPQLSTRGALLCVGKKARARAYDDDANGKMGITGPIITPGAMDPQQRGQGFSQMAKKRKMEKMRQDPVASRMPDRPMEGRGKGGRIGAAATQHMVQGMYTDRSREEDPREALLKYADKAEQDPRWTAMWKETQPKTIYSQDTGDDEDTGDQQRGRGDSTRR